MLPVKVLIEKILNNVGSSEEEPIVDRGSPGVGGSLELLV